MSENLAGGAGGGLALLDTPGLYFRAFHGVPRSVRAPDGRPVNAVRGLLDVLARQMSELRPEHLVCCFDADWRPAFRVELLPSYKAHRVAEQAAPPGVAEAGAGLAEEVPDELEAQLPVIDAVLDAFGLARAAAAGFEADDVIGTLAARYAAHGGADGWTAAAGAGPGGLFGPVEVLTGDRDLFQLVRDDVPVRVRYAVEKFALVDEAAVAAKYGIPPRAYADFATLRGDPSDGLPGVAGIGAKTAAALLARFGSLAAVLDALDAGRADGFPAAARGRLAQARDYLERAAVVVRVVPDVGLPVLRTRLPAVPADPVALAGLAERYGLAGPVERLTRALAAAAGR